jgi:catechol 2,3-dioxygenase-like lactoylglutathione lyase family enzyme
MQQIAPMEVGLVVRDLDRMLRFYIDALSMSEVRRADIPAPLSQAIRTAANGYVNVWLRSPGIGNLVQQLGEEIRFRSSLAGKLNELAKQINHDIAS